MSSAVPTNPTSTVDETSSSVADLLGKVKAIVRKHTAMADRAKWVTEAIATEFRAPFASVQIQTASRSFQHEALAGKLPASVWKPFTEVVSIEALASNDVVLDRLRDEASGIEATVIGIPVRDWSDEAIGSFAMIFVAESEKLARVISRQLQAMLSLISIPGSDSTEGNFETQLAQNAAIEQIALRYESFDQMTMAIVNGLKNKYGFSEVELGIVRGNRVRVTTISGRAKFHRGAPGVSAVQQAFEECLDAGRSLCSHPDLDESLDSRRHYVLHEQWSRSSGGCPVVTVPLKDGEKTIAIIGFRLESHDSLLPMTLTEFEQKLAPLGPGIILTDRLHRPWHKVAWQNMVSGFGGATRLQQAMLLAFAIAAVGIMVWGITPHPYIEAVEAEVGNEQRQVFAAPFASVLKEVSVRPGEHVREGAVLFRLDSEQLKSQWEEACANAELARIERAAALSHKEPAKAAEAHAKYEALLAEIDLLNTRLEGSEIRARNSGFVVGDDSRGRVGEEIAQGDTLVEVAPDGSVILKVQVPQTLIHEVSVGCRGTFASLARPDQRIPLEIISVERAAQAVQGKTIYVAEARLETSSDTLLLGTTGTARLELGERTGAWLLWHAPMRYLRNQVNQL